VVLWVNVIYRDKTNNSMNVRLFSGIFGNFRIFYLDDSGQPLLPFGNRTSIKQYLWVICAVYSCFNDSVTESVNGNYSDSLISTDPIEDACSFDSADSIGFSSKSWNYYFKSSLLRYATIGRMGKEFSFHIYHQVSLYGCKKVSNYHLLLRIVQGGFCNAGNYPTS
jgi:hypothetical protein